MLAIVALAIVLAILIFGTKLIMTTIRTAIEEAKARSIKAIADAKEGWTSEASIDNVVGQARDRINNVRSLAKKREENAQTEHKNISLELPAAQES